ncbi:thiopeptide-type bacteriocin biosynthesis protein [Fodinicola acaciae]|uniref:thiopeptide-type bacteriocin biosynthesis protein n=1 Tax=Fodinicola acaciae TaxID=2681555 RepID=UPI0013D1F955|nr:thiopeptide-type bacteriocin biosynthesis protein [Fodinicola acaciae]
MVDGPAVADWLAYRIPVASPPDIAALLHEVVRPSIGQISAEIPDFRWFFLRYFDPAGLHLRLRLRVPVGVLTEVDALMEGALNGGPAARLGWVRRLYAPETGKFGAGPALDGAERLFQLSSETALLCATPDRRGDRIAQAAAVTSLLADDLPEPARRRFLGVCANSAKTEAAVEPDLRGRAMRLDDRRRGVLAEADLGRTLSAFALAFRQFLGSAARTLAPISDDDLRFHHIHLTNNRLGVFPAEEAAIARLLLALGS